MFMKHYGPNRCEPSIEALNFGWGDQGKCERRSEFFVKFQKKKIGGGGGGGGVRVDVNGEVNFCEKKIVGVGSGGGGGGGGGSGYMRTEK